MAIDSAPDAARGEPPSHHENDCDGGVRLMLRRVGNGARTWLGTKPALPPMQVAAASARESSYSPAARRAATCSLLVVDVGA